MNNLVTKTAGSGYGGEIANTTRSKARLLMQLATGAIQRILARIELAGGNLHRHPIKRGAVLADEDDLARLRQSHNGGGAGMADDVAAGAATIGQLNLKRANVQDLAAPRGLLRQDLLVQLGVAGVLVAQHQRRLLIHGLLVNHIIVLDDLRIKLCHIASPSF